MALDRTRYDAVTFDCYGTLIDWDTGVANAIGPWVACNPKAPGVTKLIAAFAKAQKRHQGNRPAWGYRRVLKEAMSDACADLGYSMDDDTAETFSESVETWPAFQDTVDALRDLKGAGYLLGIVSNVDDASLARTRVRLGGLIDLAVTAEAVGAYKPDLTMFEALFASLEEQGIRRERVLHVAQSRHHDVEPANQLGLDCVWIDRRAGRPGVGVTIEASGKPMARFESMEAFCREFLR